jgi:2-polyprenyl-3-methyl-5-hydroxy-6-metoxy-1,4-benzoquinol methylase
MNDKNNTAYVAREMMYGLRDEFVYFQCGSCKCLQIAVFPENISKYYSESYYSFSEYSGKKFEGAFGKFKKFQYQSSISPNNVIRKLIHFLFPVRGYEIFRGLDLNHSSHILDVGCGNGKSFLYPLAVCGYFNTLGCDPFIKTHIEYKNGLRIEKASIFEMKNNFDVITYHHSFEHVSDPAENLRKVSELLSREGVCIIRIPTVSSYAWEHYKTNWAQLDAPRHFFLHSKESMQFLAKKAKLELYKIEYDSTHFQFSGSEKYMLDVALRTPRKKGLIHFIRRKSKKIRFKRKAKKLNKENRGDQAAFFFRKPK